MNAADVAVVVVPVVGAVWVMVPAETVRVKLQVPESPLVSATVPFTA